MRFNNRFNINMTIHFDPSEWVCTDPDQGQFCRVINSHTFEYIQVKDMEGKEHSKNLLNALNDKTTINDWYQDEIDINDYDADELGEYLSPYDGILDNVTDEQTRNQLIAECIFETDIICGFYE